MRLTFMLMALLSMLILSFPAFSKEPQMIQIPAGKFWMGLCQNNQIYEDNKKRKFMGLPPLEGACGFEGNDTRDNETPMHVVRINAFKLGKYEVTLGEFKAFIASTDRIDLMSNDFMESNSHGDNAPVILITFDAMIAYIDWLNETYGGGYRLPSEAEWEYACHGGQRFRYCGSNNLNEVAVTVDKGKFMSFIPKMAPVGTKKPNGFGLYDMTGNASEVVADCRNNSYVGAPSDGSAWLTGYCEESMLRGGSLGGTNDTDYRATNRSSWSKGALGWARGFRVARDIP